MALLAGRTAPRASSRPPDANVRTRVHEYGGGELGCVGDALVYADSHEAGHPAPRRRSPSRPTLEDARYADFAGSPDGRFLLAVEEEHGAGGRSPRTVSSPSTCCAGAASS